MDLFQQVTSLELSKRLKELGVKQESLFYWFDHTPIHYLFCKHYEQYSEHVNLDINDGFSAFTVGELGEMLPIASPTSRDETGWYMNVVKPLEKWKEMYPCNTEADARARMLIYLLEKKLIEIGYIKNG